MTLMLVSDINKTIEHWQDHIVYNSHNNRPREADF